MKEQTLKMCIGTGVLLVLLFPILALFSFFMNGEQNEKQDIVLKDTHKETVVSQIESNDKAKVNLDTVMLSKKIETIEDEATPLAVNKGKKVNGLTVKNDFKSHEKEIESGDMVFEVILQNGSDMIFTTYDELEFIIKDKTNYDKQFLLKDNKLVRYTYLELN